MHAPAPFASFRELIEAWPGNGPFAEDAGVPVGLVSVWKNRDSIPPDYWKRLADGARRRGIAGVTLEALAGLAELRLGAVATSIDNVILFLRQRDVVVTRDARSATPPRWLIDGRPDRSLDRRELVAYANRNRKRLGQPEFVLS